MTFFLFTAFHLITPSYFRFMWPFGLFSNDTTAWGGDFVHLVFVCLVIHVFYNMHCLGKLQHALFKWHRAPRSLHKRRSAVWACKTDSMLKLQGSSQYINLFTHQFSQLQHFTHQCTLVLTGADIKVGEKCQQSPYTSNGARREKQN